ncbi:MAG: YIP1 family protein [candidate division Zixibacteria bacterium]|nr:YIP1 family protein [candidate division Zixibacteria bacterium]
MEPNNQTDAAVATQPVAQKSIWSIMVGIFHAPTEAFAAFSKKPGILMPLIVLIIVSFIMVGLTTPYQARAQYDMMKQSTVLPQEALDRMGEDAKNPSFIKGGGFGVIFVVFASLISALVVWFVGSFFFGGTAKFTAVWGIGILAMLIPMVGGLLRLPMVIAKDSILVSYGLAAFMPGGDFTSILFSLLYYLDIFAIWSLIVAGIGYAAVFGFSRGKGIATSAIVSLLFIMFMISLTAVGMSFAGVEISFM